jgi:choline dehydrogenase-like flavoprotein
LIKDLAKTEGRTEVTAKVCIIGAGIAGLLTAWRLNSKGVHAVLLESGPRVADCAYQPLNAVEQLGQDYQGAIRGRFRCLGGTSTRWGGQLMPIARNAMESRPYLGLPAWPMSAYDLSPYLPDIEALFGVDGGAYDARFARAWAGGALLPLDDSDIRPSFSKAPAFDRRNVATLLAAFINARAGPDIWVNATVTDFEIDRASSRVKRATAREVGGREISVQAENFVVASGAIEATRLLLSIDASQDGSIFRGCRALGKFFHDHISAPLADFVSNDRRRFNHAFGYRFVGRTMRGTRLELTPEAQTADRVASAYAHVAVETEPGSGLSLIRDFLLSRQRRASAPDLPLLMQLLGQVPDLAKMAFWRARHRQLYWSEKAKLRLHVVIEQVPHSANRIQLSQHRDILGMRVATIDWCPRDTESATLTSYMNRLAAFWQRYRMDRLGAIRWVAGSDAINANFLSHVEAGDIFHPAGSTRMGTSGTDAVVDNNLRTFALRNLWVASTSVFPALGSANPTLTLMLLSLRLGDYLAASR